MSAELKTFQLEDVLDALIDYRGKTPKKTTFGIPLITAKIVKSGKILQTQEYIAHGNFNSWMVRGLPKLGDVVLTTEAPLGEVAQINELPVALAQRIVTLRGRQNVLLNDYLKYLLLSPQTQEKLHGRSSGSTVVGIKQSELRKIEVQLPSIDYQTRVARILKSLDNQIDNLEAQNTTLEALAQTLFRSWFVNFDPVHAKAAGQTPEGMSPELAALFPSGFVESELGRIPKGWRFTQLSELATLQNGYAFKSKDWTEQGLPVLKIGNVLPLLATQDGCSFVSKKSVEGLDRFRLKEGDLLVGMTGYVGTTGLVPNSELPMYLNQRVGKIEPMLEHSRSYLFCQARSPEFKIFCENNAAGSAQANISGKQILDQKCTVPTESVLKTFNAICMPLVHQILINHSIQLGLAKIRDELLPRLISGKLRIEEAEEAVAEVLSSTAEEEKAA